VPAVSTAAPPAAPTGALTAAPTAAPAGEPAARPTDLPPETLAYFQGDELRARVFHDKYALRDREGRVLERTPPEMWRRIARELAGVEAPARRAEWEEKFTWLLEDFRFIPGGRIMHAAGNPKRVTSSNCYVIPIKEDSIEAIFEWMKEAARTYSFGGGVGGDISCLRPRGAPVNNAARSSTGSVSFMELMSLTTGTIGQSGRRGALMITIADHHPDVLDFVRVKRNLDKVRYANISVRVSDAFMRAVEQDADWELVFENEKVRMRRTIRARHLWEELIRGARDYAEPGVIFWDTVKRWSTSEYNGMEVITTNPCSLVGSTYVLTPAGLRRLDQLVLDAARDRVPPEVVIDRRAADRRGVVAVRADALAFTGVKPIYRVETTSGLTLRGTGDHKVKVLNDPTVDPAHGSTGWKRIDELQPGDVLAVVDPNDPGLAQAVWGARSPDLHLDPARLGPVEADDLPIALPAVWEDDLAYLLGYAVGTGLDAVPARAPEEALEPAVDLPGPAGDAPDLTRLIDRLAERYRADRRRVPVGAGATAAVAGGREARGGPRDTGALTPAGAVLRVLQALGLRAAPAHQQEVPEAILSAPRAATAAFLRGLVDALGTVAPSDPRPMVSLASPSRRLVEQVQLLLLQFGIVSTVTRGRSAAEPPTDRFAAEPATGSGQDTFTLRIDAEPALERFVEHIGSALPHRREALEALRATRPGLRRPVTDATRVTAVVPEEVVEPVYDLTVLDTKSFIANGLIVSNSEIPLEPYGNCNLGNVNLARFVAQPFTPEARVDWQALERALRYATRFLDDILDYNADRHPLPQQREASLRSRRIGVGFTGLGDMLIMLGLKYDTDEAVAFVDRLFERIKVIVYDESVNLAREKGPFPAYDPVRHFQSPFIRALPRPLLDRIQAHGLRNVALLTVPPVGSGAALAGVTSGIEPIFDLAYIRRSESLSQETFKVYHPLVREYLARFGLRDETALPPSFVTAHQIKPEMRVKMQAAIQKHIDHSISSTVNLPHDTPVEEVERIYFLAWKLGCKGITVYREGSREGILLTTQQAKAAGVAPAPEAARPAPAVVTAPAAPAASPAVAPAPAAAPTAASAASAAARGVTPAPRPRPKVTVGRTERIETPRGRIYVVVNEDEIGISEVFVHSFDVEAEAIGRLASLALRAGVDPRQVLEQLWRVQSKEVALDRSVDGTVVRVSTIAQAVALALGRALYGDGFRPDRVFPRAEALPEPAVRTRQERLRFQANRSEEPAPVDVPAAPPATPAAVSEGNGRQQVAGEVGWPLEFVGICPDCGANLIQTNGCATCPSCGYAKC